MRVVRVWRAGRKVMLVCEIREYPKRILITFEDSGIPFTPGKERPDIAAGIEEGASAGWGSIW